MTREPIQPTKPGQQHLVDALINLLAIARHIAHEHPDLGMPPPAYGSGCSCHHDARVMVAALFAAGYEVIPPLTPPLPRARRTEDQ